MALLDIRVKELRVWFSKVWGYLAKTMGQHRPEPSQPAPNLGSAPDSRFLQVFGVPSAAAERVQQAQLGASSQELLRELVPQQLPSSSMIAMDVDEEGGQEAPVGGLGEQSLVPMVVDSEAQQENATSQGAAQSDVVVVAVMEQVQQVALIISASGNHVVQYAEVHVRQQVGLCSGAQQV